MPRSDDESMRDIGEEERQRKRAGPAGNPAGSRTLRPISSPLVVDDVTHRLLVAARSRPQSPRAEHREMATGHTSPAEESILILGGGGMVGLQVAREAAHELQPSRIIISALTEPEVDAAISILSQETKGIELIGVAGDIFIPESLQGKDRAAMIADRESFNELFAEIFSPDVDYAKSALYQLIDRHKPTVIVDCINTATAISYQDVFTVSRRIKMLLDALESREGKIDVRELQPLFTSVRELLLSEGVPQITRHILFLHRALEQSSVRVYVKVGTTGTGGMGINIPYTHSEDKPSPQLIAKSAIGFAHTGLLFLLARTPGASIIKELKPGAMIGFKRLGATHVRLRGDRDRAYLMNARDEEIGSALETRQRSDAYGRFEGREVPLKIIGADTGENGFFSIGEFQAITYPRQMEYVTPEEVARTTVLEILGASTGRDVLSAIDGAITEPSYRAGVLREQAIRQMLALERAASGDVLPSIAVGHLGPPKLSKLLIEAFLIREAAATDDIETMLKIDAEEMQTRVETYLDKNRWMVSLIVTIGIPLLRATDGKLRLTRGPRINIPPTPPDGAAVPLDRDVVERYARTGWVDLRIENFDLWEERIKRLACSRPDIVSQGSAAFDLTKYSDDRFVPGDVVGWLLTNEVDEQGMVGHRLF
ncbi:MAG TPA: hypothetical protein VGS96_10135 [Thermoanaerobaculia bacterium]|nr:hypothetical protein [Thermoanaerobaculia bacterium]